MNVLQQQSDITSHQALKIERASLKNIKITFENQFICINDGSNIILTQKSFSFSGKYIFCPVKDVTYILYLGGFAGMYIISTQTLILVNNLDISKLVSSIEHFNMLKQTYAKEYNQYLLNTKNNILCTVVGTHTAGHFGHKLVDCIPPFFSFIENNPVKRVYDRKPEGSDYFYFSEQDLLNNRLYNIPLKVSTEKCPVKYNKDIFIETCNDNLYFFRYASTLQFGTSQPNSVSVNADISKKVIKYVQDIIYPNPEIDVICSGKKVILLVTKTRCRFAVNQLDMFNLVIEHFKQLYPNVLFLVQGFIRINNKANKAFGLRDPRAPELLEFEDVYKELQNRHGDIIINLNNVFISEYIAYVKHADLYVTSCGSQQHMAHIFSKRNGIAYGNKAFIKKTKAFYNENIILFTPEKVQHTEEEIKFQPKLEGQPAVMIDLDMFKTLLQEITLT